MQRCTLFAIQGAIGADGFRKDEHHKAFGRRSRAQPV